MVRCASTALLLVLGFALVAGCSNEPVAGTAVLKRGNGAEPGTLDPSLAEDVHAFNVLADLYEGLVAAGPDGALVAGVAASWTVSEDGRRYTFELRPDARWSNGETIVAEDFIRRFHDVASPSSASPYAFLLAPIENFSAVKEGRLPLSSLGVAAPERDMVRITLDEPAPYLLSVLTMPVTYPMHRDARDSERGSAPGNGAYRLDDWRPGDVIRLLANEHYWDAGSVAIDRVEYFPLADPTAELNRYRAGDLDITHTVPPAQIDRLRQNRGHELRIATKLGLYYVALDLTEAPLDNLALREALSLAVDRESIVTMLGRGEQPAYGLVPPGIRDYAAATYSWQELDAGDRERRAAERFEAAGVAASGTPSIRLIYDAGDVHERVALAVAAMWEDVLGVTVELERLEWGVFLDTRERRGDWDAMRFAWIGDYDDATTFLDVFRSDSDQNLPAYANTGYDATLDRAATIGEVGRRAKALAAAERMLLEDYPVVPLYFYVSKHLVSPRIVGFEDNALDRHPSRYLSFEETVR